MKKTLYLLYVLLVAFTGCRNSNSEPRLDKTMVWYQPGKTADQLRQDVAACRLEQNKVALATPPVTGSGFARGYAQSVAANRLREIFPLCMESKGYQLVPRHTVPPGEAWWKP